MADRIENVNIGVEYEQSSVVQQLFSVVKCILELWKEATGILHVS